MALVNKNEPDLIIHPHYFGEAGYLKAVRSVPSNKSARHCGVCIYLLLHMYRMFYSLYFSVCVIAKSLGLLIVIRVTLFFLWELYLYPKEKMNCNNKNNVAVSVPIQILIKV